MKVQGQHHVRFLSALVPVGSWALSACQQRVHIAKAISYITGWAHFARQVFVADTNKHQNLLALGRPAVGNSTLAAYII